MKFRFDVKLTGYEEVVVEASNKEEACEKALEKFWDIYNTAPARFLRWKETETTPLDENEE